MDRSNQSQILIFRFCFPRSIPGTSYYVNPDPSRKIDAQSKKMRVEFNEETKYKDPNGLGNLRVVLNHPGVNSGGE